MRKKHMADGGVAVGHAVGVAEEDEDDKPRRRPQNASSSWLAGALKDLFELEDAVAEQAAAVATGRPNFLKTNRMLRARRRRHPVQYRLMSRKIADVFADPEDAEANAATVEAQLSD